MQVKKNAAPPNKKVTRQIKAALTYDYLCVIFLTSSALAL